MHQWVRETDPAVEIFTNDFNIISHYHGQVLQHTVCLAAAHLTVQADKYIELVEDLASRGAPIDGIGLQVPLNYHPVIIILHNYCSLL